MKKHLICPSCGSIITIDVIIRNERNQITVSIAAVHDVGCKLVKLISELIGLSVENGSN